MALIVDTNQIAKCSRARRARDTRSDGLFFTAVKTTGIYCRSICPANPPKETNVEYHDSAISAAESGFRPCLRCRPDSAPLSSAWQGTDTTVKRALALIHSGLEPEDSIESLSDRLGVTSRYLRQLFASKLGTSPQKYISYQRALLAKKLLHETSMSMTSVALSSGFGSLSSFNRQIKSQLGLTPRQIRGSKPENHQDKSAINLKFSYRPPLDWKSMMAFLQARLINGIEWQTGVTYGRTIQTKGGAKGYFEVSHDETKPMLHLRLHLDRTENLYPLILRVRELFDLDAPAEAIDERMHQVLGHRFKLTPGLRIPGVWSYFEAGIRGILGQQVSVKQAHSLVQTLVSELGESITGEANQGLKLFPTPEKVVNNELAFFRMPQARKDTIRRLAKHFIESENPENIDDWVLLKGIGPWTVNYVKLRAAKDPDVWLAGDAGVKNALKLLDDDFQSDMASPWRSYLVFQLWHQL